MVGQKGMWWKCNFDLVPMRGEIATKQLGRLIRFLYPHFTCHISHFTFPNHEVLMAPSGNASMRCPVGRAGAAPLHRPQCTKSMVFVVFGHHKGQGKPLVSQCFWQVTPCPVTLWESVLVTSRWHMAHCVPGWVVQCTMYPVLVWFHGVRRPL